VIGSGRNAGRSEAPGRFQRDRAPAPGHNLVSILAIHPHFGPGGLALALPLAAYAVIGEPLLGRWAYARLVRELRHDRTALLRFYRLTLTVEWTWTVLIAATLTVATDLNTSAVGLAVPAGPHLPAAAGTAAYMAVVVAVSSVILRRRASAGKVIPGHAAVAALLPSTSAERRVAVAVAVTAGICEEVLYRGLLIALAIDLLGLSVIPAAVLAVAVFAAAHAYQGLSGVLATGLLGAVLAGLYVSTGSLLLPIIVHVLVDLRGLVLVPLVAAARA